MFLLNVWKLWFSRILHEYSLLQLSSHCLVSLFMSVQLLKSCMTLFDLHKHVIITKDLDFWHKFSPLGYWKYVSNVKNYVNKFGTALFPSSSQYQSNYRWDPGVNGIHPTTRALFNIRAVLDQVISLV